MLFRSVDSIPPTNKFISNDYNDNLWEKFLNNQTNEQTTAPNFTLNAQEMELSNMYTAYSENRRGNALDIRMICAHENNGEPCIEFVYRNDKQSLQYLQAADPKEELGTFRLRYVPLNTYYTDNEFHNNFGNQLTFEVGFSFGYSIIKDDSFIPTAFDINRFGIGIAFQQSSFDKDAKFLAVSFCYDINNYTSLSLGVNFKNLENKPFYFGIGINQRLFKQIFQEVMKVFK